MKNFKKILASLLSVAMLISLNATYAFAESTPKIVLTPSVTEEVNPGDTVDVTFSTQNNPGVCMLTFSISYDENLTVTDVNKKACTIEGLDTINTSKNITDKPYNVMIENSETLNATGDGTLLTMTFKVSESAAPGATCPITVAYDPENIYNEDYENITFTIDACNIKVKDAATPENKVQSITGADSAYAGKNLHISPEMTFTNSGSDSKIYIYKKGVTAPKTYNAAETFAEQGIEVGSGASVSFNIAVISADSATDTFTFDIK